MVDQLQWSVCPGTDGSTAVRLSGELDCAYEGAVTQLLAGVIRPESRITVDAADVTFLDSAGLRCLVRAARDAAAVGSRLRVVNASSMVRRLFAITGIERELLGDVAPIGEVERPVAS